MPAKNRIKNYISGGVYHIYNKSVDGLEVFSDADDYETLVNLCRQYLTPVQEKADSVFKSEKPYRVRHRKAMNLAGEVEVWAYCLMPDHINFLVRQNDSRGMTKFMRRIMTGYAMYSNNKKGRKGGLWEGVYRAAQLTTDEEVKEVSRRIHLTPVVRTVRRFGPVETVTGFRPEEYPYSSFKDYVKPGKDNWVVTTPILAMFDGDRDKYSRFVDQGRVGSIRAGGRMADR